MIIEYFYSSLIGISLKNKFYREINYLFLFNFHSWFIESEMLVITFST